MGEFDAATWQALGLVLTVTGLGASALVWTRRGPASGLRAVAWSLLPLAAGLTGTLRLLWEVGDSVVLWATRLVFSPLVWLGIVVASVAAVLYVVSGMMRSRGIGTGPSAGRQKKAGKTAPNKSDRTGKAGKAGKAGKGSDPAAGALPAEPSQGKAAPIDEDLDDIEAILRKHGIS